MYVWMQNKFYWLVISKVCLPLVNKGFSLVPLESLNHGCMGGGAGAGDWGRIKEWLGEEGKSVREEEKEGKREERQGGKINKLTYVIQAVEWYK